MSRKTKQLKKKRHFQHLIHNSKKYEINDIFNFLKENNHKKYANFNDKIIKIKSHRYKLFMDTKPNMGIKCCKCGLKGTFFILNVGTFTNLNDPKRHFNLYVRDKNNKYTMLTKDHIIPKILGGKDIHQNYQTMCQTCNSKKGSKITINECNNIFQYIQLKIKRAILFDKTLLTMFSKLNKNNFILSLTQTCYYNIFRV